MQTSETGSLLLNNEVAAKRIPRVNILGVGVNAIDIPMALEIIDGWIERQESQYVCVRDVHGVIQSQRNSQIHKIHNQAGLITPDGMPLVWICRTSGFPATKRVYGPDLMKALCSHSVGKGYRHFLYGGDIGVADQLAERLRELFPGIEISGTYCPPYRPLTEEEDRKIVALINQANPHIIWVGLSTPKQEIWMGDHTGLLEGRTLIGVGAAFDFLSGRKKQAPAWMQKNGLEWIYRLISEPRRLGKRYIVNNPLFVYLYAQQVLGIKRYKIDQE